MSTSLQASCTLNDLVCFKTFPEVETEVPVLFSPASSLCPGAERAGRAEYRQSGGGWRLVEPSSGEITNISGINITCRAGCGLSQTRTYSQTPWRHLAGQGDPWSTQV